MYQLGERLEAVHSAEDGGGLDRGTGGLDRQRVRLVGVCGRARSPQPQGRIVGCAMRPSADGDVVVVVCVRGRGFTDGQVGIGSLDLDVTALDHLPRLAVRLGPRRQRIALADQPRPAGDDLPRWMMRPWTVKRIPNRGSLLEELEAG